MSVSCRIYPIVLPLPAAHLKSKKHHYHVRKRMKSDPACDQPQVPAAPPASAVETAESLSEDSCATVASGCGETSLESSQDTRTTHKEAVTLWESRWLRTAHTQAHSGFRHGSALTAGCFLPVFLTSHRVELNYFVFDRAAQSPSLSKYLLWLGLQTIVPLVAGNSLFLGSEHESFKWFCFVSDMWMVDLHYPCSPTYSYYYLKYLAFEQVDRNSNISKTMPRF